MNWSKEVKTTSRHNRDDNGRESLGLRYQQVWTLDITVFTSTVYAEPLKYPHMKQLGV